MKFTFKPRDLRAALAGCARVANQTSTLPILSCLSITAPQDGATEIELRATDYNVQVTYRVPAEVLVAGSVAVPAKIFSDLVKELPDGEHAILEKSGVSCRLTCRETRAAIQTMPAQDFPKRWEMEYPASVTVAQPQFAGMLAKVIPAIPTKDPRKVLEGLFLETFEGQIIATATDGKILGHSEMPAPSEAPGSAEIIIPAVAITELARLLDQGAVRIRWDVKQVEFSGESWTLISQQIEGKYVRWRSVVPGEFRRQFEFPTAAFQSALKRIGLFADVKNHAVQCQFYRDRMTLSAETYDCGNCHEVVPCSTDERDEFTIVFNRFFVAHVLNGLAADRVTLHANQPTTPAVFRPAAGSGSGSGAGATDFYLVMPMKLTDVPDYREEAESESEEEAVAAGEVEN